MRYGKHISAITSIIKESGRIMKITFLGGVEEVTGSRYLVETDEVKILVDCGLFQGDRLLTARNWEPMPIDAKSIDAIVLTHAHIDHTGYIPLLVKNGFKGTIYCSEGTYALCGVLLRDSASLQEEEAKHSNQPRSPQQTPVAPLYTVLDAEHSLSFFHPVAYDIAVHLGGSLQATLISSHHILGSAFVVITDGKRTLTFSGDLGRPNQLIMKSPPHLQETDYLVLESTYGDRIHAQGDPLQELGEAINAGIRKGGIIILPSFAVERTQTIIYCLYQLKHKKIIPDIPVFLDSPMAIKVTQMLCTFTDEHTLPVALCQDIVDSVIYTPTVEESKRIDDAVRTVIVIAGSGMANGGRVVHHLKQLISDSKNTVVFVGFQAQGTLGRLLVEGAKEVLIHNRVYAVRADIKIINTFSAHADCPEILEWVSYFKKSPKKVFITHGELHAALALKKQLEERFGWSAVVPKYLQSFELD
jgi:metallo-beta-lactamase family protein